METAKSFGARALKFVTDHPVESGAMALGTAAAPLTAGMSWPAAAGVVGLAGAGGAGFGIAAKALKSGPSPSVASDVGTMAGQGALQAAGEGAARGVMAAAGKAAPKFMDMALGARDRLAREFPNLSQTLIDNTLTVTSGGLTRARTLLGQAKDRATQALQTAESNGATVPLSAVTDGLTKTMGTLGKSSDPMGDLQALIKLEDAIKAGHPAMLTPTQADALKQGLQQEAKLLYTNNIKLNGPSAMTIEAQGRADMASAINAALERVTSAAGAPGYQAANHEAQQLIGATRGIREAMSRDTASPGASFFRLLARPTMMGLLGAGIGEYEGGLAGAARGATAGYLLSRPSNLSRLAIGLGQPAVKRTLGQVPRGVMDLLDVNAPPAPP
jgi:hypothetical protein